MKIDKAAESAEQQQAARERDASIRCATRAAQPVEQQQVAKERDAFARRTAKAA
jgi:DNA replication initiation complex subunit (GINS family)